MARLPSCQLGINVNATDNQIGADTVRTTEDYFTEWRDRRIAEHKDNRSTLQATLAMLEFGKMGTGDAKLGSTTEQSKKRTARHIAELDSAIALLERLRPPTALTVARTA
jgi:hypothetical protein